MNPLDWAIVVAIVYSTVRAAMRGLVRVLFSLTGAVIGFAVAAWYYSPLAPHLAGLVTQPQLQPIVAFCVLLFGTLVVFGIAGALVHRATHAVGLGFANRLGGAAFGAIRGSVLAAAVLTSLVAFLPASPWITSSTLAPYFLAAVRDVSFGMPRNLLQRLDTRGQRLGIELREHSPARR